MTGIAYLQPRSDWMRQGTGNMSLYRLEPAMPSHDWSADHEENVACCPQVEYVIVSTSDVPFSGLETLIFPASKEGEVISWSEIGGWRETSSHSEVLAALGQGYTTSTVESTSMKVLGERVKGQIEDTLTPGDDRFTDAATPPRWAAPRKPFVQRGTETARVDGIRLESDEKTSAIEMAAEGWPFMRKEGQ